MAIFKVLKSICKFEELKNKTDYLQGKSKNAELNSLYDIDEYEPSVIRKGINAAPNNPFEQAREIQFFHDLAGSSGTTLAYHLLLDFNAELEPEHAVIVGSIINNFWSRECGVAWIQGLHLYEREKGYWPHLHMVVSTRIMVGPNAGKVLHLDKALILRFKQYANNILQQYGVSGIIIKKIA